MLNVSDSISKEELRSDLSRMPNHLKDNSIPWSSFNRYGSGITRCLPPFSLEESYPSSEAGTGVSSSTIDHDGVSTSTGPTDGTSVTSLSPEDDFGVEHFSKQRPEALKAPSGFPWLTRDEKRPLSPSSPYRPEIEIEEDGEQVEHLPPDPEHGDDASAGFVQRESNAARGPADVAGFKYTCVTESCGYSEVRIGLVNEAGERYIPRWRKGAELKYIIRTESFPTRRLADMANNAVIAAIGMWQGIGVHFTQVQRNDPATFEVKYKPLPDGNNPYVYANSFFPQDYAGSLFLYQVALDDLNIGYLANIVAHEVGHVMGLRHVFAEDRKEAFSVLFGSKDDKSVMNYYPHPKEHQVGDWDLEDLRKFYEYGQTRFQNLPIMDFEPGLYIFEEGENGKAVPYKPRA